MPNKILFLQMILILSDSAKKRQLNKYKIIKYPPEYQPI